MFGFLVIVVLAFLFLTTPTGVLIGYLLSWGLIGLLAWLFWSMGVHVYFWVLIVASIFVTIFARPKE